MTFDQVALSIAFLLFIFLVYKQEKRKRALFRELMDSIPEYIAQMKREGRL